MNIWELITYILSFIAIIMSTILIVNGILHNKWNNILAVIVVIMGIVVFIMYIGIIK